MSISGIYIIRNLINGNVYIGSAVRIDSRKRQHLHKLRSGKHENGHLQKAWNKYGEDSFE